MEEKMNKKVLVTGAAGYIGTRTCRKLHERGNSVHALVRPGEDYRTISGYVDSVVTGDLLVEKDCSDIESYAAAEGISLLVSLTGGVDYHQDYETSRRINVETVENCLCIAENLHGRKILKKMVQGGSVASRGFSPEGGDKLPPINEKEDRYIKGLSVYCDVKREAEDLVLHSVKEKGLPACIIQPGSLVGPGEGTTTTTTVGLARRALKGIPVLCGGASYVSVDAVASGIVSALEKGRDGEYYLLGGENMTMKDFSLMVRKVARVNFPSLRISPFAPPVLSRNVSSFLGRMGVMMNAQQALLGSTFHYIDSSKAVRELGYRHDAALLEGAVRALLASMTGQKT